MKSTISIGDRYTSNHSGALFEIEHKLKLDSGRIDGVQLKSVEGCPYYVLTIDMARLERDWTPHDD